MTQNREAKYDDYKASERVWASGGANRQEGSLPIHRCKFCGADIVWATSTRTGKRYPVTCDRSYHGARYYNKSHAHDCDEVFSAVESYTAEADRRAHNGQIVAKIQAEIAEAKGRGATDDEIEAIMERGFREMES